jgi:hypothetical protein
VEVASSAARLQVVVFSEWALEASSARLLLPLEAASLAQRPLEVCSAHLQRPLEAASSALPPQRLHQLQQAMLKTLAMTTAS